MKITKKKQLPKWDNKYNALAIYNGELQRGLLHTAGHTLKMQKLQIEYNEKVLNYDS